MIGHILRHDSLLKKIIEGDVVGNIARERPSLVFVLVFGSGQNYQSLKCKTVCFNLVNKLDIFFFLIP